MTKSDRNQPITFDEASERLISVFPELQEGYQREVGWWESETPGTHIIYEGIFSPYVERVLASADRNVVQRVFDFIELLAAADDVRLQDLVKISILTPLTVDPLRLAVARRNMGPATRKLLRQAQSSP